MKTPFIWRLRDEACNEAYEIFDKNVRQLPRGSDGQIKEDAAFHDNDVDAFRHAYVSGRYTQEFSSKTAEILGILTELISLMSPSPNFPRSKNMDLWNNAVGRKYGRATRTKEQLSHLLLKALKNGEMIISLRDARKFLGKTEIKFRENKSVIVLKQSKTKKNELFMDLTDRTVMDRDDFVNLIQQGEYPGYRVSNIQGILTPISRSDRSSSNNLG